MAPSRAQFVVVSGPEQGERLAIPKDVVVVGRAVQCDMKLLEEHISRRQFQMEHTVRGWVLENLSANGTIVGGKRYKSGMKLLLATGDVIGVGLKTELLFVASGDDADRALLEYELAHPPRPVPQEPAAPSEAPATKEIPEAAGETPADGAATTSEAKQATAAGATKSISPAAGAVEPVAAKAKFKYLKYVIALGVSFLLVIVLLLLVGPGQDKPTSANGRPRQLTEAQIRDALEARPEVGGKNLAAAQDALKQARLHYKSIQPGHLYRCIRQYKLYQAYRGSASFEDTADQKSYDHAMFGLGGIGSVAHSAPDTRKGEDRGLLKIVISEYNAAMDLEIAERWQEAVKVLDHLIAQLDEPEHESPTHKKLITNLYEHRNYAAARVPKKKSGQGAFGS